MTSFRMPDDMQSWFAPSFSDGGPLKTEFDKYYLCLLIGLHTKRRAPITPNAKGFIDYWITDYQGVREQLLGLVLRDELEARGIAVTERDAVQKACQQLFTHDDPTQLTPKGMETVNSIAYGGFKALEESWQSENPPRSQTELLKAHCDAMQQANE